MERTCKAAGCERTDIKAKGYCTKHWQRIKRNGDTELRIAFRGPRKDYPREYRIWEGIHERCYQPGNASFSRYGARGVKVCDRWNGASGFANFIADMGSAPSKKHSIDRIDVNGGYSPENCRFVTAKDQANNRTTNIMITHDGRTQTLKQWTEELGLKYHTIYERVRIRGIPFEKAISM